VIRGLVLIALTLATGCVAGLGGGGGFTRGDPPPSTTADGFYGRFSAGGGYGTKSVIGQVLGEAAYVGSRLVGGAAVELAVIPRPEEVVSPTTDGKGHGHRGIAILGRSAYYAGADDLRALELSVGAGLAGWWPDKGAISAGVYLTSYRLDEPGGTVSWSHGIVVSFTGAIMAAIDTPR
jgi:hypothetical protein